MIDFKNKSIVIKLAGFIWGLSGFTVEIIPGDALQLQLALRLVFVVASSVVIYLAVPIKIKTNYILAIVFLDRKSVV